MKNEQKESIKASPVHSIQVYPSRWRLIFSLLLSLVMILVLAGLGFSLFQSTYGTGIDIFFALMLGLCLIYLLGFIWSALRLLTNHQPSLQSDDETLTLRHLPFLGTVTLPWSEIKSIHVYRYLFLSYLCIVPQDPPQLFKRYGFFRFALNTSSRFSLRTGSPLNISQGLLSQPVEALASTLRRPCASQKESPK